MSSPVLSHSFTDSSPPDLFGVRALNEHYNTFNLISPTPTKEP